RCRESPNSTRDQKSARAAIRPRTRSNSSLHKDLRPCLRSHRRPCPVRFLEDCDKILLPVVDRALGAEVAADGAFLWAAGGREDTRAKGARELDRRRADAARPAVHEKALSGGEPAAIEAVGPHRYAGFGP